MRIVTGYTLPKYKIPTWVIKMMTPFSAMAKMLSAFIGRNITFTNDRVSTLLVV